MSKRAINGVLDNLLGTYTSRYSDCNGYWLFGILMLDLENIKIDLLNSTEIISENLSLKMASKLAAQKFREQMNKAGIDVSYAREASINIEKLGSLIKGPVNGRISLGWTVRLVAKVVTPSGFVFERGKSIFVAPHDPHLECQSVRKS